MPSYFFLVLFFVSFTYEQQFWRKINENRNGCNVGTKGVFSSSNYPGRRRNAATWTEGDSIFIFGGYGYSTRSVLKPIIEVDEEWLSDLWEFNTETYQWRFLNGYTYFANIILDNVILYGSCSISAQADCIPTSREGAVVFQGDTEGKYFLFGGVYYLGISLLHTLNELWTMDANNQWWFSVTSFNKDASLTTNGYPNPLHSHTASKLNPLDRYVYIFGGFCSTGIVIQLFRDSYNQVWRYDIANNQFDFLRGDAPMNSYTTLHNSQLHTFHPSNNPASRGGHTSYIFKSELYIYGGWQMHYNKNPVVTFVYDDFWKYNISKNEWMKLKGTKYGNREEFDTDLQRFSYDPHNEINSRSFMGGQGVSHDQFLYSFFGMNNLGSVQADVWIFNAQTSEWKYAFGPTEFDWRNETFSSARYGGAILDTPQARYMQSQSRINLNGKIFIMFGVTDGEFLEGTAYHLNDVWEYSKFEYSCWGVDSESTKVCSEHGSCEAPNFCECQDEDWGWEAQDDNCESQRPPIQSDMLSMALGITFGLGMPFLGLLSALLCVCCYVIVFFCCFCVICFFIVCFLVFCLLVALPLTISTLFLGKKAYRYRGLNNDDVDMLKAIHIGDSKRGEGLTARLNINQNLFEIEYRELKIQEQIGSGGSDAIVFKALWNGESVAFKCFKLSDFRTDDLFQAFEKEVAILASISHPNILRFFGATLKPPRVGFIMEYCSNGDMKQFLEKYPERNSGRKYPIARRVNWILQIVNGMEYLHNRKIIHRDLKTENVLIDDNMNIKLMDFGLSKVIENSRIEKTKRVGTSKYMSPEVCKGGIYDAKCDVFSFGIMVWEIVAHDFNPYGDDISDFNLEFRVADDEDFRPKFSGVGGSAKDNDFEKPQYSWLKNLCKKCWEHDPSNRPRFDSIRELMNAKLDDF